MFAGPVYEPAGRGVRMCMDNYSDEIIIRTDDALLGDWDSRKDRRLEKNPCGFFADATAGSTRRI
jgi:hypothetical protein